jgi:BlaI family penicillinase repressor
MSGLRRARLGDLQLEILKILWRAGAATVAEVHAELGNGRLAYTTVATMLRKMEDRGLVSHREEARRFVYEAAVQAEDVTRTAANDLLERLFEGNLADAVCHLLRTRDVSPEELDRLEQLIQERRQRPA